MAVISKEIYNKIVNDMTHHEIVHPWTESCHKALLKLFIDFIIGSTQFYSVIYIFQILYHGKKLKNPKTWVKLIKYFIRSTLFGVGASFGTYLQFCIYNGLGIKRTYVASCLIPFTISGLFIYLEPPGRRSLVINLFFNLLIQYWLNGLRRSGSIEITKSKQTLTFMVGSAFLFYLMRLEGDKEKRTPLLWFYTAEKVKRKTDDSENVCPHEGSCQKFVLKGSSMYFGLGLAISLARLILPRLRAPIKAISSFKGKHLKLALFYGSYIGIYRAVICYLCRKNKKDSALYALPAGYLAGLSMLFNPSTNMAIVSMTSALKLFSTILYDKKILPENIPLPELMYCICQGLLFTARTVDLETCPPYIVNLADTVTRKHYKGSYDRVYERFLQNGY